MSPVMKTISVLMFQSSPAPKSGCYDQVHYLRRYLRRFNPHPLQRAGATQPIMNLFQVPGVSILTRSKERVLRERLRPVFAAVVCFNPHPLQRAGATSPVLSLAGIGRVSILTRSKERVLLMMYWSNARGLVFQSSPAPKSGCYCHPQRATKNKCL